MRKRYLTVPLLALALAACGQPESPTAGGGQVPLSATSQAAATPSTAAATAPPTMTPVPVQTPEPTAAASPEPAQTTPAAPAEALIADVQTRLAAHLGVQSSALRYTSFSTQTWPNGALGCPQEGMVYPQVLTSGYVVVFSDGARQYEVHTSERKEDAVLCLNEQPVTLSGTSDSAPTPRRPGNDRANASLTPTPEGATGEGQQAALNDSNRPLVTLARKHLAGKLSAKEDAISVVSIEEVEWRDSSLGCPQPDMMYMQVITPGYRITLESQGKRYVYHTNMGEQVVLCSK